MLTDRDRRLVAYASDMIRKYFIEDEHHVACALRCGGKKYPALHLDSSGIDVCAEPIALSNALMAGESDFDTIVAVRWDGNPGSPPEVIAPCGDCRQLLIEYCPEVRVILDDGQGEHITVSASDLVPYPYLKKTSRLARGKFRP